MVWSTVFLRIWWLYGKVVKLQRTIRFENIDQRDDIFEGCILSLYISSFFPWLGYCGGKYLLCHIFLMSWYFFLPSIYSGGVIHIYTEPLEKVNKCNSLIFCHISQLFITVTKKQINLGRKGIYFMRLQHIILEKVISENRFESIRIAIDWNTNHPWQPHFR